MAEDLTPPQYRCAMAMACPSVHRIVIDGKPHLLIVGPHASRSIRRDVVNPEGRIADNESAVLIEEDLLSGILLPPS